MTLIPTNYSSGSLSPEEDENFTSILSNYTSNNFCRQCNDPFCCLINPIEYPSAKWGNSPSEREYCFFLQDQKCVAYDFRPNVCHQFDCFKTACSI